jgi:uncharacterized protein
MKKHLIAYAKKPWPGYAKTRLGEKIGYDESAGVYARLLYSCLMELVELQDADTQVELSLALEADRTYFERAFPEFLVTAQIDADFGQRLTHSLHEGFAQGAEAVILIGTDVPGLKRGTIQAGFTALAESDIVIGPGTDGGYYLIGTRLQTARLFENITWSSELVLTQTEQLIRSQRLSTYYLLPLSDVDTEADYQTWLSSLMPR